MIWIWQAVKSLFRGDRKLGEEELITLKLLTHEQGRFVPTKGAVLLFGKDRIRYFPDAWMQCGRFMGQDKAEIFDHIELARSSAPGRGKHYAVS